MTSISTLYRWIDHSWYGVQWGWPVLVHSKKGLTVIVFLRCSSNKVYLMSASSLINISYGVRCQAQKVEEKSTGKGHQAGRSGSIPPARAPFSPSLGASPELSVKKNNTHNSPEVKLNSSGASSPFNSEKKSFHHFAFIPLPALTRHLLVPCFVSFRRSSAGFWPWHVSKQSIWWWLWFVQ